MNEDQKPTTSIVVDMRNIRCDQCKVAIHDDLATECAMCGARFESIRVDSLLRLDGHLVNDLANTANLIRRSHDCAALSLVLKGASERHVATTHGSGDFRLRSRSH